MDLALLLQYIAALVVAAIMTVVGLLADYKWFNKGYYDEQTGSFIPPRQPKLWVEALLVAFAIGTTALINYFWVEDWWQILVGLLVPLALVVMGAILIIVIFIILIVWEIGKFLVEEVEIKVNARREGRDKA